MSEGLSGNLAQLPFRDLLRMLCGADQTGRIEFQSGPERAEVFLRNGHVVHATAESSAGETAFAVILGWTKGMFRFDAGVSTIETTISKSLDQLMTDGARQVSERELLRKAIPSADAIPYMAPRIGPESITIARADWQLLACLNGATTVAQLARKLGLSDLETVRALYRLKQAEMIGIKVEQAAPVQMAFASPAFFVSLQNAVAAAMGPLAEIIVDDCLEALGFTRTTLPRSAMSAVAERIGLEIREPAKRLRFQQSMLETLRSQAA